MAPNQSIFANVEKTFKVLTKIELNNKFLSLYLIFDFYWHCIITAISFCFGGRLLYPYMPEPVGNYEDT